MSAASAGCPSSAAGAYPGHAPDDATPSVAAQGDAPTRVEPTGRLARISGPAASTGLPTDASSMNERLSRLQELDGAALREEWRRLCRSEPPRVSRDLLMRAIAYRLQELAFGGLPKWARQSLAGSAIGSDPSDPSDPGEQAPMAAEPRLRPGVRLVREWRGRTHAVIVLGDGFEFEGRPYRSLTQIAREITGAHWSGPRFFGLKDCKRRTGPGETEADATSRKAAGATEAAEANARADNGRPEVISADARRRRGHCLRQEVRHD
jgi:Protein of unknown function (DUF2924)